MGCLQTLRWARTTGVRFTNTVDCRQMRELTLSLEEQLRNDDEGPEYVEELSLSNHNSNVQSVSKKTFTACMEQLQEGYVFAVASTAGCLVEIVNRDFYGIDVRIIKERGTMLQELVIEAQLKATTTVKPDPSLDHFSFQFKKSANLLELCKPRQTSKAILIVMATKPIQEEWCSVDHDSMSLHHCCYWVNLEGHIPTQGVQSPTVHVPTANQFDAASLLAMFDRLENGKPL